MKIRRLLSIVIVCVLITIVNPIEAKAAWKQDNQGWWYTEGNSYAKGWRNLDGKWYYFDSKGYLVQDAWMYEGYYLNTNGEWNDKSKYTREDILWHAHSVSGKFFYEVEDESNLRVIKNEPCIYVTDIDNISYYIGMNTLAIYNASGDAVDKMILGSANSIAASQAEQKVREYLINAGQYVPSKVQYDHDEGNYYVIHCYDMVGDYIPTSGWYYVDMFTGGVTAI